MDDRFFCADESVDLSGLEPTPCRHFFRKKRSKAGTAGLSTTGRRYGHRAWRPGEPEQPLDLCRTVSAAMTRHALAREPGPKVALTPQDLHLQLRREKIRRLIVFVVDTSDSMGDGPTVRMSAALGAILSLARRAHLNREQVCLITFRDRTARLVVPPTASVIRIRRQLQRLPVGGATPLAAGLQEAHRVIGQARRKDPALEPLLVLISDGEATTPLRRGQDPGQDALEVARQLRQERVPALVIDTLPQHPRGAFMPRLAEVLGSRCEPIGQLRAGQVVELIEQAHRTGPT